MLVGAGCQGHELALPPLNQPTQKQEFPNFLLSVGSNCVLIKGALCTFQARGTCFVFLSPAVAWMLENSVPLPRLIYMKEVEETKTSFRPQSKLNSVARLLLWENK